MNEKWQIRKANHDDWNGIRHLLTICGLPREGALEHLEHYCIAIDEQGSIIGCAGVELYNSGALLRSVAVAESSRDIGLGNALVEKAINIASDNHIQKIYLLTNTASEYFAKWGFAKVTSESVPDDVRTSVEFNGACPCSAIAMYKELY